ncbi:MAG: hypothetical protein AB7T38_16215 [Nitrospirales bacterium]
MTYNVNPKIREQAKRLNQLLPLMHNFDMPTKITADSLHEALKHYEIGVREVMGDLVWFQKMDTQTFTAVFEQWRVEVVQSLREALQRAV